MNEYRSSIVFATPDIPLRDDVRRLGALVGDLLAEQVSPAFLDEVEQVRTTAIARRESQAPLQSLSEQLAGRSPRDAESLVRAFSTYFQVVNIAERVHRIRRRRDYQRAGTRRPQPDGLHDALLRLKAKGVTLEELEQWLPRIDIEPVFTAHPTEAVRRALLEKEQLMVASLVADLDGQRTPGERAADTARFRMALTSSWQTADSSPVRPTVDDEREHVGFYLVQVLYRVMPVLYESLEQALVDTWGRSPPLPRLVRFGTWVGGDMDGNPNVDADTISATLNAQRESVLAQYLKEMLQLASLLSQSVELVGVSDAVLARVAEYRRLLPQVQSRPRHADMPYRLLNDLMRARLQATLDDAPGGYASPDEFIADIELILHSLEANKGRHAGWFSVRRLLWRARTFGFHLARLDVRQESSVHARALAAALDGQQAWDALDDRARAQRLSPYASGEQVLPPPADDETGQRLDKVFAALADARRRHGADALGSYIISMAHDRGDVLAVLALARRGGLVDAQGTVPLDIAPLFETVDDLRRGTDTLRDLLSDPVYRAHLAARGDVQMVMLGYSDSGKDGGIAASRWGLQRAQVELLDVAAGFGVRLTFFHGRGGSISRGGGKTTHAVDASPRGSIDGRLRVTEQGEVIHRKYGIRALALRSLEQSAGAVLRSSLRPRAPEPREAQWRPVMDRVAEASSRAYRAFVGQPEFMAYFRQATPIDVIERMTLGSRPSRRLGEDAALSNLRAIPWVFAWSQSRAVIPGWFGVGSGLQAAADAGHEAALREMAHDWPFFDTFLDDMAMVLSKGDINIAELFSKLAGPLHERFFPLIRAELELTASWVKRLSGQAELLEHDPRLALSIRLRNPYIDPISVLQVDLLGRWRESGGQDDALLRALVACVNGVSQGVQNTG
ncbi:phosphoenolpyruvate carboxylase [Flavobacterium sp. MXW15]|uniref:Phosphoenolpyruvate carboxylase n=1 Tax=Xanthomonas chitinilytica TaxID=2989819 RepID=A0ABT3JSD1_9XANT|nr:phosphoenolpyruvate carboxylase [Xanthomonas sp. H13-6]MCW4454170.1 phosphoenolpyruvate carboxylase [Flavobacterium sp. MXW15]MCW4471404.1 phosphoenolpyruvate carboxylase [Xanthomonas sp. H13-6]